MIFTSLAICGAYLIDVEPHVDTRGSFARAFCKNEFRSVGIEFDVLQCNLAHTNCAGVVRGLHYQERPNEDNKLVRCIAGAVFDTLVDMRPDSPTFQHVWWGRLDALDHRALYVPGGIAHGYQALMNDTEFLYMTDRFYVPGLEKGLRYDDPALEVPWPLPPVGITERDQNWPLLT